MLLRFQGRLYRALNPLYAREPLSGHGAQLYGGRFNPKGVPALYASLSVMTALREANQAGSLQPTTLVSYDADFTRVFDSRDGGALALHEMNGTDLSDTTWRDQMKKAGEAKAQVFARQLMATGYDAMLVRSFAPGATAEDLNIVLWRWDVGGPARLILIDDENRLSAPALVSGDKMTMATTRQLCMALAECDLPHRVHILDLFP